jgi:hypothetical protein
MGAFSLDELLHVGKEDCFRRDSATYGKRKGKGFVTIQLG